MSFQGEVPEGGGEVGEGGVEWVGVAEEGEGAGKKKFFFIILAGFWQGNWQWYFFRGVVVWGNWQDFFANFFCQFGIFLFFGC